MKSHHQSHNTIRSLKRIRRIVHPITKKSLYRIVDIWLEAAMVLSEKDIAKMDRVLQLQKDTKCSKAIRESNAGRSHRHGEWRKITDVEFPLITHLGENVPHNRRKHQNRRRSRATPDTEM